MERVKTKICEHCGITFQKPQVLTYKVFSTRRFCGIPCSRKASGIARTKTRPLGWKRDRSRETPWKEWSLNYKSRLSYLHAKAKTRAKSGELPFNITTEHLVSLWENTGGFCALTGRPFDLTAWGEPGHTNPNAPSIDRIEPVKGYTVGNVRLVVNHINLALSRYGDDAFRALAQDFLRFGKDDEW